MNIKLNNLAVSQVLALLNRKDKFKVIIMTFAQIAFSFIDLAGIALFGILGSLAVTGSSSRPTGDRVNQALTLLKIQNLPLQKQAAILGLLAAILLITKTLLSLLFTRKTMFFLSLRSAQITRDLTSKLLSLPLQKVQERSLQENVYALTGGVGSLTNQIIGSSIYLISDLALVLVMIGGLFYVDPVMSILTLFIFGVVAVFLYFVLHGKAKSLGLSRGRLLTQNIELIQEVIGSYRESVVGGKRPFYVKKIGDHQDELAKNGANLSFLPNISKYVLEITIIAGTVLISAIQFARQDAAHSVAVLTVFLASSTRIGPAILRIQQSAIQIRGTVATVKPSLSLINQLKDVELPLESPRNFSTNHGENWTGIEITNLNFKYADSNYENLKNINLSIPFGSLVSIVGKSGAGKTTMVDLILGINEPNSGEISISSLTPKSICNTNPGALAYVPQDALITNGTIRSNICMGYEMDTVPIQDIDRALRISQLTEFVNGLPRGIDTYIGDRGAKLSGGQRQRLGIARALITKPKILVMDEATSALDNETELAISRALQELHGNTTVILIAHRLTTVKNSDLIIYMEEGKILSTGNFEKIRLEIPNFDTAAKLIGL